MSMLRWPGWWALVCVAACGDPREFPPEGDAGEAGMTSASDAGEPGTGGTSSGSGGEPGTSAGEGGMSTGGMASEGGTGPAEPGCGNGTFDSGEACDDGNLLSDDGCTDRCRIEAGWECGEDEPSVCSPICGDGKRLGSEALAEGCDDGLTRDGDGCSATCTVEAGWDCNANGAPSSCVALCGDGVVVGSEAQAGGCDDGGTESGDGCSEECQVEPGHVCLGQPSTCEETCGDGNIDLGEGCEDGNQVKGDGCFACTAESGYTCSNTSLPSQCSDVDECKAGGGNDCATTATCTNTAGSFTCQCKTGYTGNGVTCANVDECTQNTDNCNANATCTDTPGSFTCQCKPGYTGNGVTCTNLNECTQNTDNCDANATCTDTPGSFTCQCKSGFTGNGVSCSNVNECTQNTDNCDANATCTDTPGSFTCQCKSGFTGNGVTCQRNSCVGVAKGCGQFGSDDCCQDLTVTGGPDVIGQVFSTFRLDKYEVAVARFKTFINSYTGHPANGAGANPNVSGSGWKSPAWDSLIAANKTALTAAVQCHSTYQTYSTTATNDFLPMNCVTWYEAIAFCAWDGGFLPSAPQWQYAVMGGSEGRNYPWGNVPVPTDMADSTAAYANYNCMGDGSAPGACSFADLLRVGSKPAGAGKYGQLDLAGSLFEWAWEECLDCEGAEGPYHYITGGSFSYSAQHLQSTAIGGFPVKTHDAGVGFRCARAP